MTEYLTAVEALAISKTESDKPRLEKILDVIRVVSENGKRRALVVLSTKDDEYSIAKALERLGYDVEGDKNDPYSLQISWQYAKDVS